MWVKTICLWACLAVTACRAQGYEQFVFAISVPFPVPDGAGQWQVKTMQDTMQLYRQGQLMLLIKRAAVVPTLDSIDVFAQTAMKNEYYAYLEGEAVGMRVTENGLLRAKIPLSEITAHFGARQFYDFFKPSAFRPLGKEGEKELFTPIEKKDFTYPDTVTVERSLHPSGTLFRLGADEDNRSIRKLTYLFDPLPQSEGVIPRRSLSIAVLQDGSGEDAEILSLFSKIRKLL